MIKTTTIIAATIVALQVAPVSAQTVEPTIYPFYCLEYGDTLWMHHGEDVFEPASISRTPGDTFVEATDALTGEVRAAAVPRYLWPSSAQEWLDQCRRDAVRFEAAAQAVDGIEGLYYPAGQQGWSCRRDQVGWDGGALAILDGVQYGAETSCRLENPRPDGAGTAFDKVCSGEGMEWRETMTVTPTSAGIALTDEYGVSHWWRCGS
jgi:hypothetical protein